MERSWWTESTQTAGIGFKVPTTPERATSLHTSTQRRHPVEATCPSRCSAPLTLAHLWKSLFGGTRPQGSSKVQNLMIRISEFLLSASCFKTMGFIYLQFETHSCCYQKKWSNSTRKRKRGHTWKPRKRLNSKEITGQGILSPPLPLYHFKNKIGKAENLFWDFCSNICHFSAALN